MKILQLIMIMSLGFILWACGGGGGGGGGGSTSTNSPGVSSALLSSVATVTTVFAVTSQ